MIHVVWLFIKFSHLQCACSREASKHSHISEKLTAKQKNATHKKSVLHCPIQLYEENSLNKKNYMYNNYNYTESLKFNQKPHLIKNPWISTLNMRTHISLPSSLISPLYSPILSDAPRVCVCVFVIVWCIVKGNQNARRPTFPRTESPNVWIQSSLWLSRVHCSIRLCFQVHSPVSS